MLTEIKQILISPNKSHSGDCTATGKSLPVTRNEFVEGRILESISPDRTLLLIKGRQVVARTNVPLRPGDVVLFKVEDTEPICVLKMVEARPGRADSLIALLKGGGFHESPYKPLLELLKSLSSSSGLEDRKGLHFALKMRELVENVALRPEKPVHAGLLKSFFEASGLMWEQKLKVHLLGATAGKLPEGLVDRDLKGLALASLVEGGGGGSKLAGACAKFLEGLEQLQLLNLSILEEKGKLLLTIPLFANNDYDFVQLLIDRGNQRGKRGVAQDRDDEPDGVFKLAMFLRLSQLGPIRVDVSILERVIQVSFLVVDEGVGRLLGESMGLLKDQLERHEFFVQEATWRVEKPERLTQLSLLEELLDPETHAVSLMV